MLRWSISAFATFHCSTNSSSTSWSRTSRTHFIMLGQLLTKSGNRKESALTTSSNNTSGVDGAADVVYPKKLIIFIAEFYGFPNILLTITHNSDTNTVANGKFMLKLKLVLMNVSTNWSLNIVRFTDDKFKTLDDKFISFVQTNVKEFNRFGSIW